MNIRFFFFQAEDGIRDPLVTGVQTCALPIYMSFARLLHAILMMPAEIRLTKDARRVVLKRNPKDRPMMKLLESALHRLTDLKIRDLSDRDIEFCISPM